MSTEKKLEDQLKNAQKKLKEVGIQTERLDRTSQQLLKAFGVTSQELAEALSDPTRFTPEEWEELKIQKKKLDDKLKLEMSLVRDPRKVKSSLSSLQTQPHWLFVR